MSKHITLSRRGWFGTILGAIAGAKVVPAAAKAPVRPDILAQCASVAAANRYYKKLAMERLHRKFVFRTAEQLEILPRAVGDKYTWRPPFNV